jgi:hypothetical protein
MPILSKDNNSVRPRLKNSSSIASQMDALDGNISDGNGSELTSRQEGASGTRDDMTDGSKLKPKTPPIKWSVENEKILVEWCDVAVCYKWMHTKAHQKYSRSQAWYTIPAIVLSTISGTASFAQGNIPTAYQSYAPLIIGTVNIFIGILTTIQQYLKISELNEGHRIAGISWDKFSRNIRIELAKDPSERMKAEPFLKMSRQEFDRLMETSPSIPPDIIKDFMTTFGMKDYKTGFDITKYSKLRLEKFESLIKPDVCDLLISSAENRHHWYQEFELVKVDGGVQTEWDSSMNPLTDLGKIIAPRTKTELETRVEDDILKREEELRKKEQAIHDMEMQLTAQQKVKDVLEKKTALKEKTEAEKAAILKLKQETEEKDRIDKETRKISDYISVFNRVQGRPPITEEIKTHFAKTIDSAILGKFLDEYTFNPANSV